MSQPAFKAGSRRIKPSVAGSIPALSVLEPLILLLSSTERYPMRTFLPDPSNPVFCVDAAVKLHIQVDR